MGKMKFEPRVVVTFLLLLLFSVILRLLRLDMGFWRDEIITITEFVSKPWLKIITDIPYPNNHILYSILSKLSILLFGEKEWSARLPAMIFGSLTPPIFYLILKKRFSQFVSISAATFLSLNFWSVWFSQDARGYSGMILLGLLGIYFFLKYIEQRRTKFFLGYVLCAGISVHFHLYGLFLIMGELCWAMWHWTRKKIEWRILLAVLVALVLGLILYLPGAEELYKYTTGSAKNVGLRGLNFLLAKELLSMLAGNRNSVMTIILGLIALPGFFRLIKKWSGFLIINLIAAIGVVILTYLMRVFIYPRFLSFLLPLFALGLALSLEIITEALKSIIRKKISITIFSYCLAGLISISFIPSLVNYYRLGKAGFRDLTEYLRKNHSEQKALAYGITPKTFLYYYPEAQPVEKSEKLSPELIKGKVIISDMTDWDEYNIVIVSDYCFLEKVWFSSGFKENTLALLNCP